MALDLLICVATALEGQQLRGLLPQNGVAILTTGVGPVNAAAALSRHLAESGPPGRIVCCGVGGALPGSGLQVGEVASATSEFYADLGADSPDGFLDMEALGFPVVPGPPTYFNRLPVDVQVIEAGKPFVTRTTCTGTDQAAKDLVARTGGAVESMEGAAIVHVALLHGVPVGEVRGISNFVGNRDRASWRLEEAAETAQRAVAAWWERR